MLCTAVVQARHWPRIAITLSPNHSRNQAAARFTSHATVPSTQRQDHPMLSSTPQAAWALIQDCDHLVIGLGPSSPVRRSLHVSRRDNADAKLTAPLSIIHAADWRGIDQGLRSPRHGHWTVVTIRSRGSRPKPRYPQLKAGVAGCSRPCFGLLR